MSEMAWEKILIAIVSALVTGAFLLVRERFARRREERDRSNWQLANLDKFYIDEYLHKSVKESRHKIQTYRKELPTEVKDLSADYNRISHALQRIGIMIYLGGVPLSYALIMNGYQIVSDWTLISDFVAGIRGSGADTDQQANPHIPVARRHAEWLALLTWMWLKTRPYGINKKYRNSVDAFEKEFGSAREIARREKRLYAAEESLVASSAQSVVKQIRFWFTWYRMKTWVLSKLGLR